MLKMSHQCKPTGEKPFKCLQCGYRSRQKSDLKRHINVHSGTKPFRCLQCDYRSTQKSNLKRHINVHSDAKPFRCSECGDHFK